MTAPLYFAGIDPGLTGAVALYRPEPLDILVFDMPLHVVHQKRHLDLYQLGSWFDIHRVSIKRAFVENVHSMPAQGVASSFKFGFTAGAIQGIVAANAIPMQRVEPSTWKRAMKLKGGTENKDASRRLASELFPTHSGLFARAKDDGRAEAVLLAYYGSRLS